MPSKESEIDIQTEVDSAEESESIDYQALYRRALADQENARKRLADERSLISKMAIGDLVLDLLPVLDNFNRATEHVPAEHRESGWMTGILHIRRQLLDALSARGVHEITAQVGDAFDPQWHEAIGSVINHDLPDDHLAEVKSLGYKLHDRVIRPVQVIVSTREAK
jgi:molecular chaperone GrpE